MDHDAHQHLIDAAGRTTAAIGEDEEMMALDQSDLSWFARAAFVAIAMVAGLVYAFNLG